MPLLAVISLRKALQVELVWVSRVSAQDNRIEIYLICDRCNPGP